MSGFLSKQAAHLGWRKRWYELSSTKLSWYNAPSKKTEIGNLPLFLVVGVEASAKPTQFIIRTKDEQKPQIVLQAATASSKDEWVHILTLTIEQRKARNVEDQLNHSSPAIGSDSGQQQQQQARAASSSAGDGEVIRDDEEPKSSGNLPAIGSAGSGSGAALREEEKETEDVVHDVPSDVMSKEAQEKFVKELRLCVIDKDVGGVRAMMDPPPPRDSLVWFSLEESGRTLLHLAVDGGDIKVADLLATFDARLLELTDHAGWAPLHLAAYKGNVEMGELLLKLGAPPDVNDNVGRSPL
jgi:hypothetical protein